MCQQDFLRGECDGGLRIFAAASNGARMESDLPAEALDLAQAAPTPEAENTPLPTPEETAWALANLAARDALAKEFPDALKEGSELAEACREELAYLREAQSPLADDPEAEYKVAKRMARMMGLANRPACEKQVRRAVRPMPTLGAPVESAATTLERRMAGAKSTGEMLELMREVGTPFEALLKR